MDCFAWFESQTHSLLTTFWLKTLDSKSSNFRRIKTLWLSSRNRACWERKDNSSKTDRLNWHLQKRKNKTLTSVSPPPLPFSLNSTCVPCWSWRTPAGLCHPHGTRSGCGLPWQPPRSLTWWRSQSLCTCWCWNLGSLSRWRRHRMARTSATGWPRLRPDPDYRWRCTNHWKSSQRLRLHHPCGQHSLEKTYKQIWSKMKDEQQQHLSNLITLVIRLLLSENDFNFKDL